MIKEFMHSLISKYSLILILTACSATAFGDEGDKGLSRRGFLRGFLAAGAVAAAPSSVLTGGAASNALPPAVLQKLAKIRIESLDTVDSGLRLYINQLRQMLEGTNSRRLRRLLDARIVKAEDALSVYKNVQLAAQGEVKTVFNSQQSIGNSLSRADVQENLKLNKTKIKALQDLDALSPDLQFLIIRSVLDIRLMNKMAWQAHYGADSLILNQSDVALLEAYQEALEMTLIKSPAQSMSAKIIPSLLTEVNFVLENTALSVKVLGSSLSCKSFI